jgi:hypothetical protein
VKEPSDKGMIFITQKYEVQSMKCGVWSAREKPALCALRTSHSALPKYHLPVRIQPDQNKKQYGESE